MCVVGAWVVQHICRCIAPNLCMSLPHGEQWNSWKPLALTGITVVSPVLAQRSKSNENPP